jgi:phage terminase large subunit
MRVDGYKFEANITQYELLTRWMRNCEQWVRNFDICTCAHRRPCHKVDARIDAVSTASKEK